MTVYLFHVFRSPGSKYWLVYDESIKISSRGGTRAAALRDIEPKLGTKITKVVRYSGYSSPSEMAMTLACLAEDLAKQSPETKP